MKTVSRMCSLLIAATLLMGLSAGCGDSHSKQEAGGQPAVSASSKMAADDRATSKSADAKPSEKASAAFAATDPDAAMGFKHTLKPGDNLVPPRSKADAHAGNAGPDRLSSDPPDNSAKSDSHRDAHGQASRLARSSAMAAIAQPPADDDRYADVLSAPAVGAQAGATQPQPAADPPLAANKATAPAELPVGVNPLRTPGATESGRPVVPPSVPPAAQPTVPQSDVPQTAVSPENPTAASNVSPQPVPKPEVDIQIKPDASVLTKPAVPAAAQAPAAEKNPQPKEISGDLAGGLPRTNKNSGVPFDPVKENGKFFVDWPKPKLALVITGNQEGYLEPCGCAGLDRMKGGMSRRYSFLQQLRQGNDYRWPVVPIDVGNIAKGFGKQAELKFQIAVNAMSEMHYLSATLGPTDLHLPTAEVMALTMPPDAKKKTIFVCGNVGLFAFDETLLPRTQLIAAGFKTIGVTAVLGKTYQGQLKGNPDLKTISAENLLKAAVPLLKSRANYLVLLAQATHDEAVDLAKKFPDFDLVVCADGHAEPPDHAEEIRKGGTKLIEVGEKGMYAVVVGLYDDAQQPMRYQRVTLDSRFPASDEMKALMTAYQGQLKELGLDGLGIRPLDHPLKPFNGAFVGTDACKNCHEESYRVWKKSPHSRAFATLKNARPSREYDPECISCHVVGWNPSGFFPYKTGYLGEQTTPKLTNVGCEDCHGPGQKHVWAENHGTPAEQDAARKTVVVTKEEMADPRTHGKQNCWACHDLDNSPEFKFDLYWPYVKHYERE